MNSGKYEAVFIHGLGVAVDRAINIALQLKAAGSKSGSGNPKVELSANTSTVDLIDDLEPVVDSLEPMTRSRRSSAIHIKVSLSELASAQLTSDLRGASSLRTEANNALESIETVETKLDTRSTMFAKSKKPKTS